MNFNDAVVTCLRYEYASFSGRARRSEYWNFVLLYGLIGAGFGLLRRMSAPVPGLYALVELANALVVLGLIVPWLAVSARRLHDTGRSGWWQLLPQVALATFLASTVVYVLRLHQIALHRGPVVLDRDGHLVSATPTGSAGGALVFLGLSALAWVAVEVVYLVFMVSDSKPDNEYGPSPKGFVLGLPPVPGPGFGPGRPVPAPAPIGPAYPAFAASEPETYLIGDYVDPGRRPAGPRHRESSPWSSPL